MNNVPQNPNPSIVNPSVATPPTPATASVPAPASTAEFFDQKTKDTVIWSMVGYFARGLVGIIGSAIVYYMLVPSSINVGGIVVPLSRAGYNFNIVGLIINSIIGGAIAGLLLSKWYGGLLNISNKYLGGKLNNVFRWIFYPAVIGGVLSMLMAGSLSFSIFGTGTYGGYVFTSLIIGIVATVAGSYIYAKFMQVKIGHYYN